MSEAIKAVALTDMQLRMLDIGAPVIVMCKTLTGESVPVRLQTRVLTEDETEPVGRATRPVRCGAPGGAHSDEAEAGWRRHGAYVAVMPMGVDYGS